MSGKRILNGLGLTAFWPFRTKNWNTEMDQNLLKLSAMTGQVTVESRTTGIEGWDKTKIYIVPSNAAENANKIAVFNNDPQVADQAWVYITAQPGWVAFIVNEAQEMTFLYGAWAPSQFTFSKAYMETGYDQRWLTDLTLGTGFTQASGYQACRYRKAMTFIDLDLFVSITAAASNGALITTLPAGYRPPGQLILPVGAGVTAARVIIGTDGTVRAYNFSAAGTYGLQAHMSSF